MGYSSLFWFVTITYVMLITFKVSLSQIGDTDSNPNPDQEEFSPEEMEARKFLQQYDKLAMEVFYENAVIAWRYGCDITDENSRLMVS